MDVFKLFGTIAINSDGANREIEKTSGLAEGLSKTFGKIGSAALKVGAVAGAGFTAAAAGVGVLMKKSVQSYAEYEQLEGGVKKLFGDSADTMMKYAQEAYKTAGMSANQYMSQATSFAASLIQSCGGDTAKAADIANMAMQDMADNANTFGTDMQSIQNAYQGFSKQNYTMLDNLKLGYGGTRSEMQRLLKDAQKIQKQNGVNVKYNIKNLDDIYEAIHVIQEANGIAGTTAAEAAGTIAGSWNSASAAWDNLLVGMASGTDDMDSLISNFAESATNVITNVTKILPNIANGLTQVIAGLIPMLPGMVETLLPSVLEGAVSLISGLISILPSLISSIGTAISAAWTGTVWPMIQDLFKEKFNIELPDWDELGKAIDDGWNNTVWPAVQDFFHKWFAIDLPDWQTVSLGISTWWADVETSLAGLFETVFSVFTEDADGKSVIGRIVTWWSSVTASISKLFQAVFNIFTEDEDGNLAIVRIGDWWANVTAAIGDYFQAVFSVFTEDEDGKSLISRVAEWWAKVWIGIGDLFHTMFQIDLPSVEEMKKAIKEWWADVVNGVKLKLGIDVGSNQKTGYYEGGAGKGTDRVKDVTQMAHAEGAVFSKPTFFETRLGRHVVGEAGAEAVAPIDVLQGYVAAAVASQNAGIANALERVVEAIESMDANMGSNMRDALEETSLKVNNREFARMVKAVV